MSYGLQLFNYYGDVIFDSNQKTAYIGSQEVHTPYQRQLSPFYTFPKPAEVPSYIPTEDLFLVPARYEDNSVNTGNLVAIVSESTATTITIRRNQTPFSYRGPNNKYPQDRNTWAYYEQYYFVGWLLSS